MVHPTVIRLSRFTDDIDQDIEDIKLSIYYIVEIDNLLSDQDLDDPIKPGVKTYSVIKVDSNGAFEVDRAYRNVQEALEQWPEAIPPRT